MIYPIENDIETEMIRRNLCKNRREFSENWLGRTPQYLSAVKGKLSAEAMLTLWSRLQAARHHDLAAVVFGRLAALGAGASTVTKEENHDEKA